MTKPTANQWVLPPFDASRVGFLQAQLACPVPIAALLAARNITNPEAFFHPTLDHLHSPHLLLGIPAAVARIQHAVGASEPILIYGDYDVDGTTATVLLKTAIERIAPPQAPAIVTFHVPHRLREGYGIQPIRLAEAAAAGVRLVISVDTGIRAFAAADEARALNLDLIVTDHHLVDGSAVLPHAVAVINPAQPGCPYPNKHLCGAAVAFKLAHALLLAHATTPAQQQHLRDRLLPSFLKLVAIATIADSVPLTGENRAIVTLGLRALANPVQPGLRALMQVADLPLDRSPTAAEVGFRLAPRINAAGRMDIASDVVDLLLTRDPALAQTLASKLNTLNDDRRATEAAALEAIELQLQTLRDTTGAYPPQCIVLDHPEWHRGVLGILASRIVDRTARPALVLTSADGEAHGSGRSVPGYHLLEAITHAHDAHRPHQFFTRFGGHAHAVGFSFPAEHIHLLRTRMQLHSAANLLPESLTPTIACDAELTTADLTLELARWIERCAPFGIGNPEPVFLARGLTVAGPPRIIKQTHLCLPLASSAEGRPLSAMGWSRPGQTPWADRAAHLTPGTTFDAVFHLRENKHPTYAGLELNLLDLKPHPISVP